MLLAAGAKAVHWAIGSPPIVAPNYYGMGIDTLDELAFWQIWKRLPPEQRAQSLRFHKMGSQVRKTIESNIAASINAATITYLPFPLLVSLLPGSQDGFDLSPFTFEMPTPAGQERANRSLLDLVADLRYSESSLLEVRS
ncbi:glutamine phosphoribosylpyrophosphate amidotransferase [Bradyrhizobium sp. i1.3.6]